MTSTTAGLPQQAEGAPSNNGSSPSTKLQLHKAVKTWVERTSLYVLLHFLSSRVLIPKLLPNASALLSPTDLTQLATKLGFTVHALHVGMLSLSLILRHHFHRSVFTSYPPSLDLLYLDHISYTAYDMLVFLYTGAEKLDMWMHHLFGIAGSMAIIIARRAAFFPTAFAVTELTIPVTNLVWVMDRLKMQESDIYKYASVLRAMFFVVFRLFIGLLTLLYAFQNIDGWKRDKRRVGGGKERWEAFWKQFTNLPWWVQAGTVWNVGLFTVLNVMWSKTVIKAAWRRWRMGGMGRGGEVTRTVLLTRAARSYG